MPYIKLEGTRLFYERHGEGHPPLIFVHGFSCAHDDWQAQVGFFHTRQCVVTYDLRGHGASSGDAAYCDIETYGADVSALMHTLDLPPAILIGHSLGCRVVLQAYLNAPQRVAGLALIDGSHMGTGDPQAAEQGMRQHIEAVGYPGMMRQFFADMFLAGSDPVLMERIVNRALTLPESIGIALFSRMVGWDAQYMEAALQKVTVPLLLVQSTYVDPARVRVSLQPGTSTPWLELVRKRVATAQIEIVSGVGHFTMLEAPNEVNQQLAALVARVSSSSHR
jgi:pimeloyl-ACP methyl ester carboxylesterase